MVIEQQQQDLFYSLPIFKTSSTGGFLWKCERDPFSLGFQDSSAYSS